MGLVYMAKAGFQPDAALAFWKRMQDASQGAPPQILSDHPSDANRIGQIEGWLPEARAAFVAGPPITVAMPAVVAKPAPAPAPVAAPAPPAAPAPKAAPAAAPAAPRPLPPPPPPPPSR